MKKEYTAEELKKLFESMVWRVFHENNFEHFRKTKYILKAT